MQNLAQPLAREEVFQEVGTVAVRDGSALIVETDSGRRRARRALSCLVEPRARDRVLVATSTSEAWVLAVLERADTAPVELRVDGDVTLAAPSGRLGLVAQDGVAITTASEVAVASASLRVSTVAAEVSVDELGFFGRVLKGDVGRMQLVADAVDSVIGRVTQRAQRVYRFVEELEHVRAERLDMQAKRTLHLRGKDTLMSAEELMKINGDQIHLG
jgi:hypothetical protein